eukprot:SAG31_NODE_638_length_13329_cov_13.538095_7_plen_74_part_00
MYIIDVQPGLHGLPFGEALRLLHGCVVVGVKTGGSVIISPSDDYKLQVTNEVYASLLPMCSARTTAVGGAEFQ